MAKRHRRGTPALHRGGALLCTIFRHAGCSSACLQASVADAASSRTARCVERTFTPIRSAVKAAHLYF